MTASLPARIALFPLSTVLFPSGSLSLHLFEQRYLKLMEERADIDPIFGVVLTKEGREVNDEPEVHDVGTAASLVTGIKHEDGRYSMFVQGTRRFRVGERDWDNDYLMADVEWLPDLGPATHDTIQLADTAQRLFLDYVTALADRLGNQRAKRELPDAIAEALVSDPDRRSFQIAGQLPLNTWQQQTLLEIDHIDDRLNAIVHLLRRERRLIDIAGPSTSPDVHPRTTFSAN